jgi:hypothetical protein
MNIPRYIRARVTITDGKITEQAVEGIQQVVTFIDGYPLPAHWERIRDLTEKEMKALNISFASKIGDNPCT